VLSAPDSLSPGRGKRMSGNNPVSPQVNNDELRSECNFSAGARGNTVDSARSNTNVVFLDADVFQAFKDSASVN